MAQLSQELQGICILFTTFDLWVHRCWAAHAERLLTQYHINYLYSSEDILQSIFEDFYTGKRIWDPIKYTNIQLYVELLIRNLVRNLARHESKKVSLENLEQEFIDDVNPETFTEQLVTEECLKHLEGDDTASLVFLDLYEDLRNREVADDLGISVKEVENTKKRIRRKLGRAVKSY